MHFPPPFFSHLPTPTTQQGSAIYVIVVLWDMCWRHAMVDLPSEWRPFARVCRRTVYGCSEIGCILFTIGSAMFFKPRLDKQAVDLFVVGSVAFLLSSATAFASRMYFHWIAHARQQGE